MLDLETPIGIEASSQDLQQKVAIRGSFKIADVNRPTVSSSWFVGTLGGVPEVVESIRPPLIRPVP